MQMVEVNTLKEWVKNWFITNRHYHPYAKSNNIPIPELYDILERAPTIDIDAVPVAHGRWIIDKGLYRCSICNHLWSELWWAEIVPLEKMTEIMPYCPKCGAKMDGEEDHHATD